MVARLMLSEPPFSAGTATMRRERRLKGRLWAQVCNRSLIVRMERSTSPTWLSGGDNIHNNWQHGVAHALELDVTVDIAHRVNQGAVHAQPMYSTGSVGQTVQYSYVSLSCCGPARALVRKPMQRKIVWKKGMQEGPAAHLCLGSIVSRSNEKKPDFAGPPWTVGQNEWNRDRPKMGLGWIVAWTQTRHIFHSPKTKKARPPFSFEYYVSASLTSMCSICTAFRHRLCRLP